MDVDPQLPPQPPQPLPVVEDVFADTLPDTTQQQRPAPFAAPARPELRDPAPLAIEENNAPMGVSRTRLYVLYAAIGATLILLGVVFGPSLWARVFGSKQTQTISNINQVHTITNTVIPTRTNRQVHGEIVDSDGDGLTDAEEQTLGTNAHALDTDNDGLTDKQEAKVYNTNPKNSDSDSDGFTDGDEVKHFYNPNGSGKLINVNEVINSVSPTNVNQ